MLPFEDDEALPSLLLHAPSGLAADGAAAADVDADGVAPSLNEYGSA